MRLSNWMLTLSCAALVCGSSAMLVAAPDEKASGASAAPAKTDAAKPAAAEEKATADKPAKKAKAVKLTKPWKDMASLSDEQKAQIGEIHRKSLEEIKQVEQRERDAILALLNDQQKAEYQAMTEKQTAEKKMKKPAGEGAKATDEKAG